MDTSPKNKVFFCSTASRYYKEMLAGTAATYQSFILVEYNLPFPQKVTQTTIDAGWLSRLQALAKEKKGKVVLIRNKHSTAGTSRVMFVDCAARRYFSLVADTKQLSLLDLEMHIYAAGTVWQTEPFFLVCTNGKKDKCCAKFGFPVFKFFEGMLGDTDVWECTHIGGDRFAANAVYLPFGIYYGRVTVEDIPEIIDQSLQNSIYQSNYRGISTLSFYKQSVECYIREYLNEWSIDFSIQMHIQSQQGNDIVAHVLTQKGNYEISVTKQLILYPHYLTCTSKTRGNITKYMLNHIKAL